MSDVNNLSHNGEYLNVSKVYQNGSIKRIWPEQNEPWCTRQTRPCTYMCYI